MRFLEPARQSVPLGVSCRTVSQRSPGRRIGSQDGDRGCGRRQCPGNRLVLRCRSSRRGKKGTIAVGSEADVVLFDPNASQVIRAESLHSNGDYTLLEGRSMRGRVEKVFLRGNLIVDGPQWLGREGMGRFVPRGTVRAF